MEFIWIFANNKYIYIYICIYTHTCIQVHLKKFEYGKKKRAFFSCSLFQKVKLSYILDSLHVK